MIRKYVDKLIKNFPKESKCLQNIDLIFDGGAFNGSYLIGAAFFLKRLESKCYVKVDRISACSIGSFISLLYISNCLDMFTELYEMLVDHFKKEHHLDNFESIYKKIKPNLPKNIHQMMTNRVYITYHDAVKNKKMVIHKYKSIKHVFDTIYKSCFIPIVTNGNFLYKNRYYDGLTPYIFEKEKNKKILFLNLISYNKIGDLINIKNEKTNYHRVLSGLLEIHTFYIKNSNTQMCSYVNEWGVTNYTTFFIKKIFSKY
jgi:hypothetical protein